MVQSTSQVPSSKWQVVIAYDDYLLFTTAARLADDSIGVHRALRANGCPIAQQISYLTAEDLTVRVCERLSVV